MNSRPYLAITALLLFAAANVNAIQLGLLDDFEAGPMQCTTDGWAENFQSPNPPTADLLCGELDTCCLQDDSAGGFGPGSRQVVFNEDQWAGDYIAAGVNKIQMQVANASATESLHVRIGVTDGNECFVSTEAVVLPPNTPGPAGLTFVSFFLDAGLMTQVTGNSCAPTQRALSDVLANVTQLRILSSAVPAWEGDAVVSTIQIDAIQSKADTDLDGVNNDIDNCTLKANADQVDTNGDGFGNACDADLNDDCAVNFGDLAALKAGFFPVNTPDADFTGDGNVNFGDLAFMKSSFFNGANPGPGPGLGACGACTPPDALGANGDFAGLPMFMRGGLVNDWGATAGLNSFSDQTGGLYVARFEMTAGSFEWKIADEGWSIEYCSDTGLVENTSTAAPLFGCTFPANGTITVPATGCYEFQMQTDGAIPPNSVDVLFTPVN